MREGKARVIIGDTLSKYEALGRVEMRSFCTFKDFFIIPNPSRLYINLDVCRVIFFFPVPFASYSIQGNGKQGFSKHIVCCLLCATHHVMHQKYSCEQPDLASAILQLRVGWTSKHTVVTDCNAY